MTRVTRNVRRYVRKCKYPSCQLHVCNSCAVHRGFCCRDCYSNYVTGRKSCAKCDVVLHVDGGVRCMAGDCGSLMCPDCNTTPYCSSGCVDRVLRTIVTETVENDDFISNF